MCALSRAWRNTGQHSTQRPPCTAGSRQPVLCSLSEASVESAQRVLDTTIPHPEAQQLGGTDPTRCQRTADLETVAAIASLLAGDLAAAIVDRRCIMHRYPSTGSTVRST
jgi:hypothetical protein